MWRRSWSIRAWLGGLVAAVALPLLLLLVWIFAAQLQRELGEARETALRIAKATAAQLHSQNESAAALLAQMAQRPAIRDFDGATCDSLFAIIDFFPQYATLFLFDRNDALVCSAEPQAEDRGISARALDWINGELKQHRLRNGIPMIRQIDAHWVSILSVPVTAKDGSHNGTLHRRTRPGGCAGGRWSGTHHGRGGAREVECELEGASGSALGTVRGEEVGGRLRGLLDGGDVAIPRDSASEVTHNFARIHGRWWIGCKSEEQCDGRRGWELLHPQRTIVTWWRLDLGDSALSESASAHGAEPWRRTSPTKRKHEPAATAGLNARVVDVLGRQIRLRVMRMIVEGNETVLVVDDELVVVSVAHDILTRHGYRVLGASSGPEALVQILAGSEN